LYFLGAFSRNANSYWCWIDSLNQYFKLGIGLDYGCLWLCWITTLIFYLQIVHSLKIESKKLNINEITKIDGIKKLTFIPLVFIIQRIPGSVNRLLQMAGYSFVYLNYFQAFCDPLQGFANFVMYTILSPVVLKIWRASCCKKKSGLQPLLLADFNTVQYKIV